MDLMNAISSRSGRIREAPGNQSLRSCGVCSPEQQTDSKPQIAFSSQSLGLAFPVKEQGLQTATVS